jgi:hypothetical protein
MKGKRGNGRSSMLLAGRGITVLVVSMVMMLAVISAIAQDEAEVTVTVNAPEYVEEGETFDVTIEVDSVIDFNSARFDLSFNSNVVEVKEVTVGQIDDRKIPIYEWDNIEPGTITVISGFPEKFDTRASGSGHLAKITFEVKREEDEGCVLEISYGELVKIVETANGEYMEEEIPAEWINATINMGAEEEEDDDPTPTPSTSPTPTDGTNATNVTNVTDVTNVTATPTPALAPEATPTPEAKGTPTPQEKKLATGEKTTPLPAVTPTPTPTPKAPGFEPIFAILLIFGLAYILLRRKK